MPEYTEGLFVQGGRQACKLRLALFRGRRDHV